MTVFRAIQHQPPLLNAKLRHAIGKLARLGNKISFCFFPPSPPLVIANECVTKKSVGKKRGKFKFNLHLFLPPLCFASSSSDFPAQSNEILIVFRAVAPVLPQPLLKRDTWSRKYTEENLAHFGDNTPRAPVTWSINHARVLSEWSSCKKKKSGMCLMSFEFFFAMVSQLRCAW